MNLYAVIFVAMTSLVLMYAPQLSHSYIYFGVHVGKDFRKSEHGKRILLRYRLHVLVWVVLAFAVAINPLHGTSALSLVAPFLPFAGSSVGWVLSNRLTRPFALQGSVREASLAADDRLPWWSLTAIGPFAILAGAAVYLYVVWDRIPAVFPVHWDANGHPNRWVTKTPLHIYGELALASALVAFVFGTGLVIFYNVRRSSLKTKTLAHVIGTMYLLAYTFGAGSLIGVVHVPAWVLILPGLLFIPLSLAMYSHAYSQPEDGAPENTPDECWHAGAVYYNPDDPSLLVEKRTGAGYTFNFANRQSWMIIGAFAGLLILILVGILSVS